MASHRLKRSMRGALAATAVAAAVGINSVPASADPPGPDNPTDAAKQFQDLSKQAEKLTEDYKHAQERHAAEKANLDRANADAAQAAQVANQARVEQEKFRGKVDKLANASYQGARLNKLSALLVSESPNDFLDRASALDVLAKDNNDAVKALSAALDQAEAAQRQANDARARATKAEADAARIQGEIGKKKTDMDSQVREVKQKLSQLTGEDRESMSDSGEKVGSIGGAGQAVAAVNAALSKQGRPYVYGAKGPNTFDCSGLIQWAYEQAGVKVGGSTKSQVKEGKSVSASELKPGDLIFYGEGSSVHHVGMFIGGDKMVHASTSGEPVKVDSYKDMGEPVSSYRRVAG